MSSCHLRDSDSLKLLPFREHDLHARKWLKVRALLGGCGANAGHERFLPSMMFRP